MSVRLLTGLALCLTLVACDSGDEFTGPTSSGTGGAGGTAGSGGSQIGGGGTGSGTGGGGAVGGSGGFGGAPTCPGSAPGCVNDWAGQFNNPGDTDGVGQAAQFEAMSDIAGDGTYLYVTAHNAIRRIEIASATVTTWAGTSGQNAHVDAQGNTARFGWVAGIVSDGTTVWVTDEGNSCIRAIDIATATVSTLAGSVGNPGVADGTGAAAQFTGPRGLTHDGTYLYLAESGNHAIRRIDPTNGAVVTVAGGNGSGLTEGAGSAAQFAAPRYVWAAGAGDLYVGDTENHRVRHVVVTGTSNPTSTVSTAFGSSQGHQDGVATSAQFDRLRGVAYDGSLLVVADSDNCVLRTADLGGNTVATLAGQPGSPQTSTHGVGIYGAAGFNKPMHVYYEPTSGDLFITEDSVIRRMIYP
ncbi:MAG: hypothetical protein JRI68_19245 [Deltaproteobacteria bacterium]|nr:hypothetical protein [Deltaproteobacteria bacterium]